MRIMNNINPFRRRLPHSLHCRNYSCRAVKSGYETPVAHCAKLFSTTSRKGLEVSVHSNHDQHVDNGEMQLSFRSPDEHENSVSGLTSIDIRQPAVRPKITSSPAAVATIDASNESGSQPPGAPYWQRVKRWTDVSYDAFNNYRWQCMNGISRPPKLYAFLQEQLPGFIADSRHPIPLEGVVRNKEEFIADVIEGMKAAPMAVKLTPHVMSLVDWLAPRNDPIMRQFLPLKSSMLPDHPALELDSLHEEHDEVVEGLVHRYPDKVLFLATSICPVFCRYCTRSYAVGASTESVVKSSKTPSPTRWNRMFEYIRDNPQVEDVVVSGGDAFMLEPEHLEYIGNGLLSIPHVKRIRIATKGLAVCPVRFSDEDDAWTRAFLKIHDRARRQGVQFALHTHFNHPNEITWTTQRAARKLFAHGVTVRNQTVLLRGINNDVTTMTTLIRSLAEMQVHPYYVYQGDMVKGVEDLRTPLWEINRLEQQVRGTIAGFMMPNFVVDLPGGGGKRLASSFEWYDQESGISAFKAPAVAKEGGSDRLYYYHDPVDNRTQSSTSRIEL